MISKTLTKNNSFLKPAFLLCILFTISSCLSQKQKQLLEEVENYEWEISTYRNFSKLNFEISSGNSEFDPSSPYNFENYTVNTDTTGRFKNLENYFKEQKVHLDFLYPYNLIIIDEDKSTLQHLLGVDSYYFSENPNMEPIYLPKKVTFLDGTSQEGEKLITFSKKTISEKYAVTDEDGYENVDSDKFDPFEDYIWFETDTYEYNLGIDSSKPVKSIQYDVHLPVTNSNTFKHLQMGDSISTSFGKIYIHKIENNSVLLEVPSTIDDNQLQISALYKDGRLLSDRGTSKRPMFSKEQLNRVDDFSKTLQDAKQEIQTGNILTKEDLDNYIQQNTADYDFFSPKSYAFTITYAGPIHEIFISINEIEPEGLVFNITQEFNLKDKEYFLARDILKDSRVGIINKRGKWVVKPVLTDAARSLNSYFIWDQMSYWDEEAHLSYDNTYWFDHKKQKLHKVDYKVFDTVIYEDKYCIIEKDTNGYKGVVNVITGEIVIPLNKNYVRYNGGEWEYE